MQKHTLVLIQNESVVTLILNTNTIKDRAIAR